MNSKPCDAKASFHLKWTLGLEPSWRSHAMQGYAATREAAMAAFQHALALDPQSTASYQQMGLLYLKVRKDQEAEAEFRRALETNRKYAPAYFRLGKLYYDRKDDDRDHDDQREAVEPRRADERR